MKSVYYHKILVIYSSIKELDNLRSLVGKRYIDHLFLSDLQGLTNKGFMLGEDQQPHPFAG
jgi:hypothetical protein